VRRKTLDEDISADDARKTLPLPQVALGAER
jgi:hypothetical protein